MLPNSNRPGKGCHGIHSFVTCTLPSISRYLSREVSNIEGPCPVHYNVKYGLSSLIAGDTLCQQLVVRTATVKALPTCEAY